MADVQALRRLIQTHPLIDNHAHNILSAEYAADYGRYPLESIASEAQGDSLLKDGCKSLPHFRAISQLAELYGCPAELNAVKAAREAAIAADYEELVKKCLHGTHLLLIDDGLDISHSESFEWHDRFTPGSTRRIVRIESLAGSILKILLQRTSGDELLFDTPENGDDGGLIFGKYPSSQLLSIFEVAFKSRVKGYLDDVDIAGFKSVICYRSGLAVKKPSTKDLLQSFSSCFQSISTDGSSRIHSKPLNDHLVVTVLAILHQYNLTTGKSKPIQFHTGLGDSDIELSQSDPALLQSIIEEFEGVDFVLLHSSYPFTRQAGYLASSYKNVYLDLGEVFPMISRDGQISVVRQALELVPTSKLLWSTDGHFHPETFWLANLQFRQALESVFTEYVYKGDFTVDQAMTSVADILFNNSNELYNLDQTVSYETLMDLQRATESSFPELFAQRPSESIMQTGQRFMAVYNTIDYYWLQFVDYTATVRVRMLPARQFYHMLQGKSIGITMALMNLLQNDTLGEPGALTAGQFLLRPDVTTLSPNLKRSGNPNSATVMTFWKNSKGKPLEGCPRHTLQNLADKCKSEFGISLLIGFEVEVVFMKPSGAKRDHRYNYLEDEDYFTPWVLNHSWSNMTSDTRTALPLVEEIASELLSLGIEIEQFHAESSPGQFEFVLPPSRPLASVDLLIRARQVIVTVAERYGVRATLYPRPSPNHAGTASHAHISVSPTTHENSFLAGMLEHFPSVLAFTFPQDACYARVLPGIWAGGIWVAWGDQNRETPIRKISNGHWEIKSMDGMSNPYLAMAAVIGAGYLGLKNRMELKVKACNVDPMDLNDDGRKELGITTVMPTSTDESIAALKADTELQELLGKVFVKRYIAVRQGEQRLLNSMSETKRRNWLIEKY
ncbi:TPA_exp: Extracellular developmental signal biosynthesis protein FluG [Trichophyton benhamiae CBS 112371]|uniref:Extracellular developmental signal biosynthesis protein FluG n=1 Tax=Arthroderma benhamiae (strain ATCC MYA-4681 / CBS 112371) TaxID=663331 RepID=D4ASZ3_ARTBC|nr:extracellular developmental signal biosynthesis protein FluG [Trichophyton benhamiae CBS 112371]EFE33893.1 extracellular developmental signal biosynthesis protein FluG [Trichophyton benhamiae CBS 112371]DAA76886.1 TPA_exp: Extracellular developmental signal biosynthesis protein FluG [Trichophyton benhamiae CBS 112371]